jgi:hypothetical protein
MEKTFITYQHFKKLLEMVWKLSEFDKGWDQCGALPITDASILRAIRLLYVLRDENILRYDDYPPSFDIPTKESIHEAFNDANEVEGTEDYWKYIKRLTPTIDYNFVTIIPTPIGGIEFSWCCYIALVSVQILPENNTPMLYECGYIDESHGPPKYCQSENGETFNYYKIASLVKSNISHCF